MRCTRSLLLPLLVTATQAADKITYDDHVFRVFEQSCLNCHNPDKQRGGLDLSTYSGTLAGGSGGKIVEVGEGDSARLIATVTHAVEPIMPPKGGKIPDADINILRSWVAGGMLENKSSSALKPAKPAFDTTVNVDPSAKPDGPPPMPGEILLEPVVTTERAGAVRSLAASPWAPLIAVTGQRQVLLYETETLELVGVLPFPEGKPESVAFTPNGRYLIAGGGIAGKSGTTVVWDVTTGRRMLSAGREFDSVLAADLRPDLGGIALGGPARRVKIWDLATMEETHSIKKHTDWLTALDYSPDGILLATGDRNGGVYVWESHSGNEFHSLRNHQAAITAAVWRADSNLLATTSEDGTVRFWEMNAGNEVRKIDAHAPGVLAFAFARDGRFVTSGRDRKVKVWKADFSPLKDLPDSESLVLSLAFNHDGTRIFSGDAQGDVTIWDAESGEALGRILANPPTVAMRISELEATLATVPERIKGVTEAAAAATRARAEAAERLANNEARHKALSEQIAALIGHHDKAKGTVKSNEETVAKQRETREVRKKEREELAAVCDKTREELAALDEQIRTRTEAVTAAGDENPPQDDELVSLNSRRGELQTRLGQHEQKLAEQKTALETLDKETQSACATVEAAKKEVAETGAERDKLKPLVDAAEKSIQPDREALAAAEATATEATAAAKQAAAEEAHLRGRLIHWQTAAVNTDRLSTAEQLEIATLQHEEQLDCFTAAIRAYGEARDQLALHKAEEARLRNAAILEDSPAVADSISASATDPALDKHRQALQQLREELDVGAIDLARLRRESQALDERYAALRPQ